MTQEQFFPTRWVLHGIPSRDTFADHLRKLRNASGRTTASKCIHHAHWCNVYPRKRNWTRDNSRFQQIAWLARYARSNPNQEIGQSILLAD